MIKWKRVTLLSFVVFCLLIGLLVNLSPLAASTSTITIYPSDDTYVCADDATGNYGNSSRLKVGKNNGDDQYEKIAYLKFDLSSIPDGAVIISATLKLYDETSVSINIKVYRVAEDWSESDINWNNKPSFDESYTYASVNSGGSGSWFEADITELVEEWLNGTYNNYGVALRAPSSNAYDQFYSKEDSDSSKHPRLVIEYVEPNTVTQTITETQTVTETQMITETQTETQTVTETTTIANTTITETTTQTVSETITTTQTINNTVYSTVTTTVANTTYTIYETISPAYGNQTTNYYVDLTNQLMPLIMVIGVICTMLSLLLSATKR